MRTPRLTVLLTLVLLAGCEALQPAPDPSPGTKPGPLDLPAREGLDTPRASPRSRSPSRWLDVSWPQPLRTIETGVAGPAERPILWFRLGLGGQRPGEAVRRALDALEAQSPGASLRSLHADPNSGRVVGQLRGSRFAASVVAEDSTSSRELRVTVELLDTP